MLRIPRRRFSTVPGQETFGFLLEDFPTDALRAYSFRLLDPEYAGDCIEVRRSSDNTAINVGFDENGFVDTAAILAHCGVGNGFIKTWYDQCGNSNAVQNTNSRQAKIVNAGVLITNPDNGMIAAFGDTDVHYTYTFTTNTDGHCLYASSRPATGRQTIFIGRTIASAAGIAVNGTMDNAATFHWGEEDVPPTPRYYRNRVLIHNPVTYPSRDALYDSITTGNCLLTMESLNFQTQPNQDCAIGYPNVGLNNWPEYLQEFIHYSSDAGLVGIQKNIIHYWR